MILDRQVLEEDGGDDQELAGKGDYTRRPGFHDTHFNFLLSESSSAPATDMAEAGTLLNCKGRHRQLHLLQPSSRTKMHFGSREGEGAKWPVLRSHILDAGPPAFVAPTRPSHEPIFFLNACSRQRQLRFAAYLEMTDMVHVEELAAIAIDRGIYIHKKLGPGLLESVYEAVMEASLARRGLAVERQKPIFIEFDGMKLGEGFRADVLVEGQLIIEIKAVDRLAPVHGKQLLTYLRLARQPVGLLMSFGAETFREGLRRVVNNHVAFAPSRLRVNQPSCAPGTPADE